MSFAGSILQVEDVAAAEFFFREVLGFIRVRAIGDVMVELYVSQIKILFVCST